MWFDLVWLVLFWCVCCGGMFGVRLRCVGCGVCVVLFSVVLVLLSSSLSLLLLYCVALRCGALWFGFFVASCVLMCWCGVAVVVCCVEGLCCCGCVR